MELNHKPAEIKTGKPTAQVLFDVAEERVRQRDELGYTVEHDDEEGVGHLIYQAGNYVAAKPTEAVSREDLVKGAALLVAAIEVLDRKAAL